ncbi:hypothetical protein KO516_03260 [Citreicella sp. C3M06]|uniref:hypothetical protein n=1 Tax=Citreicella sp. C3M06 TaxID=2841564 RepID=UPI001C081B26|nr:hypothetical protein [Citreicella sp. C3M06]MBU2959858.1 hypothetical protein [Citreicella sp. C3M06]
MTLKMTASEVKQLGADLWSFEMPPHHIRHFGSPASSKGARSVILFDACIFSPERKELSFRADDVTPLNVGTTSTVIGILTSPNSAEHLAASAEAGSRILGPGDREFISLVQKELSQKMVDAATLLLESVRERSPGDLKRGKSRNFSETPDNFWYIIVQPRIDELSITIRGPVDRFEDLTKLEVKDDRGNTRFKVRGPEEVEDALNLIFHANRKS